MGSFDELGIGPENAAAFNNFLAPDQKLKQEKADADQQKLEKMKEWMEAMEARKHLRGEPVDDCFVVQADGRVTRADGSNAQEMTKDKIPVVKRPPKEQNIVSATRTYVIVCKKPGNTGCFLRRITLPFDRPNKKLEGARVEVENNACTAIENFLNEFDRTACVEHVMSWEDYINVKDCNELRAEKELADAEAAIEKEAKGEVNGDDLYPDFTP